MSARFTVTVVPVAPDLPDAIRYLLACPHGETSATHLFGPAPDERDMLALLVARHEAAEHCGCAASVATREARA
jgi:hypothetical protein